jgi:D-inositol-3-phosphate glycosyltransferase
VDVFTRQHAGEDEDGTAGGENVRVIHLDGGPVEAGLRDLLLHVEPFTRNVLDYQKTSGARYDVVHSHYWLSALAGRRLAESSGARHVATFHTLAELKRRARSGEDEPGFRSRAEGDIMRSADWITASTPHEAEAMAQLYDAPRERVKIVHCVVDTSLFRPMDASQARRRLGLNGEKVALYVGRIEPLKGVEFLLRIADCVDGDVPFKLLIVGGDPASEAEPRRLAKMAGLLGLNDVVEFVGRAPRDTLATYFSAADVCIVPSYYESFGLVALEAMACGAPVVATRVGGLPWVVKHGRNGYLLPWRCPERFADTLAMIFYNESLRNSLSRAALETADAMSWDRAAGKFIELYGLT